LSNASVGNDVQISGSATFAIGPSTTIQGNLQIHNIPAGPAQNQIYGSSVGGNLQFQNNGTAVQIGSNDPPSCGGNPGNIIGGNLEVQNNSAATVILGNTVAGNLHDQNNTAPTRISNNTITNNLHCQNNSSITETGNTAKQKQGQCSNF